MFALFEETGRGTGTRTWDGSVITVCEMFCYNLRGAAAASHDIHIFNFTLLWIKGNFSFPSTYFMLHIILSEYIIVCILSCFIILVLYRLLGFRMFLRKRYKTEINKKIVKSSFSWSIAKRFEIPNWHLY